MDPAAWQRAVDSLSGARHVVVFTGAGISAESGIPTFRDDDGFWQRFPPDRFATWPGLLDVATAEPRRLAEFAVEFLDPIARAEPNAAHRAIARLEQHVHTTLVTQNVDGLHQAAGSIVVREIHGTVFETVEALSGRFHRQLTRRDLRRVVRRIRRAMQRRFLLPRLAIALRPLLGPDLSGLHRPRVVLFGDALAEPDWQDARDAAAECDVLLLVGTSGTVWPAAELPSLATSHGAELIVVDPERPDAGTWLQGTAADVVPRLVQAAFSKND